MENIAIVTRERIGTCAVNFDGTVNYYSFFSVSGDGNEDAERTFCAEYQPGGHGAFHAKLHAMPAVPRYIGGSSSYSGRNAAGTSL
jgi:hypothetical protein